MKNSTDEFLESVKAFLKMKFSELTTAAGTSDIRLWQSGFSAVLNNSVSYPTCILATGDKSIGAYLNEVELIIGVAVTSDVDEELDRLGRLWEDIIEEAVRSDYHLGESCVDSNDIRLTHDCVSGVYIIQMIMTCTVYKRSFVYEEDSGVSEVSASDTEGSDPLSEVQVQDEDSGEQKSETSV